MSTVVLGKVIINQDTVYSDDFIAEAALFDVDAGTILLLLGNDQLNDSAIGSAGQVRADDALMTNGLALTDDATFVNLSTLTQLGSLTLGISPDDAVEARNLVGATWEITGDEGVSQTGAGSSFVNFGLFEQTSAIYGLIGQTDVEVDADFIDRSSGVVEALGALAFDGPVTRIFGDVTGSGTVSADDIFLDGATVSVRNFDAQTVVVRGVATITSDNVTFSSPSDTGALYLRPTSTLQFQGQNTITLGNVYGAGEIDLKGMETLLAPPKTPLSLVGDLKLVNSGSVSSRFGGTGQVISLWSKTIHGGTAEIDNLAGATWIAGFGEHTTFVGDGTSNTLFDNAGVFEGGDDSTTFEVNVVNDGSFEFGGVIFDNPVTGTGTIDAYDSALTFNSSVGAGQTIVFSPNASFAIEDVPGFAGVISDFDQSSTSNNSIDFNTSLWKYQDFAPNSNGTGGALIFSDGFTHAAVNLSGTYDPAKFHAALTGNQTVITYG